MVSLYCFIFFCLKIVDRSDWIRLGTTTYLSFWSLFIASNEMVSRSGVIKKANMMYLTKEATNKDQSLKIQLLLSADDKTILDTELIWKKTDYF